MKKIILLMTFVVILMAGLSGCVKLQMPDDMISDAVRAIKGDDDEVVQKDSDSANTFTHSVVAAADSSKTELMQTCHTELKARTAELLGMSDLNLIVTQESISVIDDKLIANCAVAVE